MAILFEDWCTADGGTDLAGVVTLTPIGQQAAGSLTLATVPKPITVAEGQFSETVTPGDYMVNVELHAGDDEVRVSTDNAAQRIAVADIDTPQRLRDLVGLGGPGDSPLAKLNAIVTAWIEGVADAAYAPVARALPTGGSTGQVPVKTSEGVVWQTPAAGGGAATVPALTPAATPSEILGRFVDFRTGLLRLAVAGDSALNDGNDPPRKLLLWLKRVTDGLGLSEKMWPTQVSTAYGTPVVVEPFSGTPSTGGVVMSDDFNRTAAELVGSTSSGGQVWAGGAGSLSINGEAVVGSGGNAGGFNCGSKAIATVADYKIVTTNPATAAQSRIGIGATQANFSTGGSYVWVQIAVTTSGVPQVSVWKRISGVNTQIGATATIAGLTPSNATPQDLRVKAEIAIQAVTVTLTVGGVDQVINANVTEGDTGILGMFSGIAHPANTAGTFALTALTMSIPFTPGTTGDGLEIWNGAVGGTMLSYQQARIEQMYPADVDFDILLVSGGHNYSTVEPAAFITQVDAFIEAFKAVHPETLILVSSQNPQFAPSSTVVAHARRQAALRKYAMDKGYEYLPVFEAFAAQPDGGASLVNPTDGVHPTVSSSTDLDTWCGNTLWLAVILVLVNARRAAATPMAALPS
ncbi:minor tail protein [Gordonia phage MagicMan]|nr:minor tail protein [Gordonia phage MagicMan]